MVSGYDEGIVINLFFYLVTLTITFIDTYIYKFLIVDRNKRYIEGAFGRYISPDVVKEISKNTKALQLGGANRRIAVYFSDIANFTTLSETLGTEKIFTLLGEYLSAMTEILIENRGTLDKYIGDAVM
jgi:adenylate cyclase